MTLIRVAGAALNQTPLDWDGNLTNILRAIEIARQSGAKLLCLPELCITGYGCEDTFHSPSVHRFAWEVLRSVLPATEGMIVALGLPVWHKGGLFDAASLVVNGQVVGFVAKQHLASEGLHYEPRWFKAWPEGKVDEIRLDGRCYPIGDLVFDCGGIKIGFEICEDAWVAQRPGANLARLGVDCILNPSASHFAFGKLEIRKRFVVEGSRAFHVSYVYSNLLGNEAGRIIYDGGVLIASGGRLVAMGPRFSFQPVLVTAAVVDVGVNRMDRARAGSFLPQLGAGSSQEVRLEFSWPEIDPEPNILHIPKWETGPNVKEEEFFRAITLGLFDYLRKSRSRGFVVSLSGGADSSATSCLVALMVERATAELGMDGFRRSLPYIEGLASCTDSRACVRTLLWCIYQASRHSSAETRQAAETVAEAIGARFASVQIDDAVEHYVRIAEGLLGRTLNWETDDLALQNIQARVRAPLVWLLANLEGKLLLATGNRSEAAVGYATMDGDTCGGLSPLGGIDKAFLLGWLVWLEKEGPEGLHPIPALAVVNRLLPTAELRPQEAGQTDEADLMPYDVLDVIERAAIRDRKSPVEVFRGLRTHFPHCSPAQLATWVERFFILWCRNQWKRERYAPSFHLDDENLDPKTWCRFPILSGGMKRELDQLRQVFAETNAEKSLTNPR